MLRDCFYKVGQFQRRKDSLALLTHSLACHQDRLFWAWEEGVRVHDSQTRVNPDKLSKDDVISFIHQHCQQ